MPAASAIAGFGDCTAPEGCTPKLEMVGELVGIPFGTVLSDTAPAVGNGLPNSITDEFEDGAAAGAAEPADCKGGTETVGALPPGEACKGGACNGGTETIGASVVAVGAIAIDGMVEGCPLDIGGTLLRLTDCTVDG